MKDEDVDMDALSHRSESFGDSEDLHEAPTRPLARLFEAGSSSQGVSSVQTRSAAPQGQKKNSVQSEIPSQESEALPS
jgi:hypothetical protein